MADNAENIIRLLECLDIQKKDLEVKIEQFHLKVGTLKRRREKLSGDIALIQKLKDDKYIMLSSTKTHVETNQVLLSDQQLVIDRSQEALEDFSGKTQEQATRRFDMIGEFEEEIVKLSEIMANQTLNGTLKRLNKNINEIPKNVKLDSDFRSVVNEAIRLKQTLANIKGASNQEIMELCNGCSMTLSFFSRGKEKTGKTITSKENELYASVAEKNNLLMSSYW